MWVFGVALLIDLMIAVGAGYYLFEGRWFEGLVLLLLFKISLGVNVNISTLGGIKKTLNTGDGEEE